MVESLILVTQIILLDDDIIEFAFILINPSLETNFDRFGANDRLDTRQIHRAIIMSYEKRAAGGKMANQIGPKNVVGRDKLIIPYGENWKPIPFGLQQNVALARPP